MKKLKNIDFEIIFGLMRNARISDRQLAKELGVSQPTVSRRRARLEKENLIRYNALLNFEKFGFDILAFTFVKYNPSIRHRVIDGKGVEEMISKTFLKHPNIIFASSGQGLGYEGVALSIHTDYNGYTEFMRSLKIDWGKYADEINSFIVSMKGDNTVRPLTFKHVAQYITNKMLRDNL